MMYHLDGRRHRQSLVYFGESQDLTTSESSAVWAGRSRSPRQTLRHGAVVVALAPLASLIFGPVVKEEPAASSTS